MRLFCRFLAWLVFVLAVAPVHPSTILPPPPLSIVALSPIDAPPATILFKGTPLLRLRTSPPGISLESIASAVVSRLQTFMEAGGETSTLDVRSDARGVAVAAGQLDIVEVTSEEARANNTAPEGLAAVWVGRLRDSFDTPWVWVPAVTAPLNEDLPVRVHTNGTEDIRITGFDAEVLSIRREPARRLLTLRGRQIGETVVGVTCGLASTQFRARVLQRAGRAVRVPAMTLYGSNIPSTQIGVSLRSAVLAAIDLTAGAQLIIDERALSPSPIAGQTESLHVPVKAEGPNLVPFQQELIVPVCWSAYPRGQLHALWVSNDPERIGAVGDLFSQELAVGQSARLLYHHKNTMDEPCNLNIEILNPTDGSGMLAVVESSAGPTRDEIHAGHIACLHYLKREREGTGYLLSIPPGKRFTPYTVRLAPSQIASGIWQLTNIGTAHLIVRCRAVAPSSQLNNTSASTDSPLPPYSLHVYPGDNRDIEVSHEIGRRWSFISIGFPATPNEAGNLCLAGNYGILHTIRVRVSNPHENAATALLTFAPSGGVARGTFYIDGERVEAPTCSPPSETVLKQIEVPPLGEVYVSIETMPEAGSNYPIRLIVKPNHSRSRSTVNSDSD